MSYASVHRRAAGTYRVTLSIEEAAYVVERLLEGLLDKGLVDPSELPFDWKFSHQDSEGRVYPFL